MPRAVTQLMDADQLGRLVDRLRRDTAPAPRDPLAVLQAHSLIREGVVVSCGEGPADPPLAEEAVAPTRTPAPYRLTQWSDADGNWRAQNDRVELDVHGAMAMTHIDTLKHFYWNGLNFFGGSEAQIADQDKPWSDPLEALRGGIIGRGVLIDVPGMNGYPLAPGTVITLDDLLNALELQQVDLHAGDSLFISFGRTGARRSDVPLGSEPVAGLSFECAEWIAERRPAVVVTDNGLDPIPSEVAGVVTPWHVLLLTGLGVPLVDAANLIELTRTCSQLGRWEFYSVMAPLHIRFASGAPINPVAIF